MSELATPPRGKSKTLLPKIEESLRAEQAYVKVLRTMLKGIAEAVMEEVLPEADREVARQVQDAMAASLWERIRALALSLAGISSKMVDRIMTLESERHSKKFVEAAQKALGVDLRAVVRQQDLEDLLSAVSIRNAALIRDIAQETVEKIAQKTTQSVLAGQGHQFLKRELREVFAVSDSRAKLIARDQTAKLNSDLNRFRQKQAGVDKYVWRTSMDERVRPRHKALEGRTYEWGEPTGAEDGLPPGQPVQCRCVAQGVVEF
jgi:SPP1 gp7 family putative phage head morphogenesis protein